MALHKLKIKPEYFEKVANGTKKAELRKNDRTFRVHDDLDLQEWDGDKYTGREIRAYITDITDVSEWLDGYVLISVSIPLFQKLDWGNDGKC